MQESKAEEREREERLRYYTRRRAGGASSKEIDRMVDSLEVNIPILRSIDEMERILSLGDLPEARTIMIDPHEDAPAGKPRKSKRKKR